jgi:lambda family phage portal protein
MNNDPAENQLVPIAEEPAPDNLAIGGAYEGASRIERETATWRAPIISPDREVNRDKETLDARGRDMVRNDGYLMGAQSTHKDSIVGSQFTLNARPAFGILGLDEQWSEEFQNETEALFALWAESPDNWPDASGRNTLTGLVRLALGTFMVSGEVVATAEWKRSISRPFSTCIQMIDPDRLCNPDDREDTEWLRRGVEIDRFGEPTSYWFRYAHRTDWHMGNQAMRWKQVPARKPWGRPQVVHIVEQMRAGQTRGVAEMVAALKEMRMTKRFNEVTLQNAVINASYAATIESELPREAAYELIGAGAGSDAGGSMSYMQNYLGAIAQYLTTSPNVAIDGAKIPYLPPGSKLSLNPVGKGNNVGSEFHTRLLQHIAAALGLSYEQLTKDYSKTNYSSARASMAETWKYMQSRKRLVADRFATTIYSLWLEEAINAKLITSLPKNAPSMYANPLYRAAYTQCEWIGASRGQIDELKETQAAVLRINSGLSTREREMANLGTDYRVVMRQLAREKRLADDLGLTFEANPTKPGTLSGARKEQVDTTDDTESEEDNE